MKKMGKSVLSKLDPGCKCTVCNLDCVDELTKRRLLDLGITTGSELVVKIKSPFGGPILLGTNDQTLAIRKATAMQIEVESL